MKNNWTTTTTADSSLNMMSLFDYLGHAAGSELGKQVALTAAKVGVQTSTRHVSNKKYKGEIMLYPQGFLDWYFEDENDDTQNFKHDNRYSL
jgi:hypothetical protein